MHVFTLRRNLWGWQFLYDGPRVLFPLSLTCVPLKLPVSYLSGKYINQPSSYQHMVTVAEKKATRLIADPISISVTWHVL